MMALTISVLMSSYFAIWQRAVTETRTLILPAWDKVEHKFYRRIVHR